MVKNIINVTLKVLVLIVVYVLQFYVFNINLFFGITANICLSYLMVITLLKDNKCIMIYALIMGIVTDIFLANTFFKYVLVYLVIVCIIIELKKIYRQGSKTSLIIYTLCGTLIYEIILLMFNIFAKGQFINIFTYISWVIKEGIINTALSFVLYLICRKIFEIEK